MEADDWQRVLMAMRIRTRRDRGTSGDHRITCFASLLVNCAFRALMLMSGDSLGLFFFTEFVAS